MTWMACWDERVKWDPLFRLQAGLIDFGGKDESREEASMTREEVKEMMMMEEQLGIEEMRRQDADPNRPPPKPLDAEWLRAVRSTNS